MMLHFVIDVVIVFDCGRTSSFADASIPMCLSHAQLPLRSVHILVAVAVFISFLLVV